MPDRADLPTLKEARQNRPAFEEDHTPSTELQRWADVAMWKAPAHDDPQHPKVTISVMTPDPLGVMAMINGQYTGKVYQFPTQVTDEERKEAWEAFAVSRLSRAPAEWLQMSILFENVSRAFTHQLVRTRMGGYAQESMRFAVKDDIGDAVKLPPSLAGTVTEEQYLADCEAEGVDPDGNWTKEQVWRMTWDHALEELARAYKGLVDDGMPAEDARGLLPTNILTRIHMHVDIATLIGLSGMRLCTQAQFEWREVFAQLAKGIRDRAAFDSPENAWQYELIANSFRPVCYSAGKCVMKAKSDRHCSIRAKVDKFEEEGIPSSSWEDPNYRTAAIRPVEWLADPTAARVAPGQE